jgi:hypothetical protein
LEIVPLGGSGSGDDDGFDDEFGFYDSEECYSDDFDEDSEDELDLPSIPPAMLQVLARTFASQPNPRASPKPKAKLSWAPWDPGFK